MSAWITSVQLGRSRFLIWRWAFWRSNKLSPFAWEFWHDPEWQKYALINLKLWFPNKLLFILVVLAVGHGIGPIIAQSAVWDLGSFYYFRWWRQRHGVSEVRQVGPKVGAGRRLVGTVAGFACHKLLLVLVVTHFVGTGTYGLLITGAVQAVSGVIENPMWFFFTKYVLDGNRLVDLPRVALQRLQKTEA